MNITHCLQEDVLLFVNEIGSIIHSNTSHLGGYASKCDGETFLLVWKISSDRKEVPFIEASPAPDHLKSKEQVVDFFQNIVANEVADAAAAEETKENLGLADSALIATLSILSQLRSSTAQVAYRDNQKLMRRFEYPFITNLNFSLHTGWAVQGSMGSMFKVDPGYISSCVHVTSKMHLVNTLYGSCIMMSHIFHRLLSKSVQDRCRLVDCVHFGFNDKAHSLYTFDVGNGVKNFGPGDSFASMSTSAVLNKWSEVQSPEHVQFVALFNKGTTSYLTGDWGQAKMELEKAMMSFPGGENDSVGIKLLGYMRQANFQCPPDWSGYRTL